MVRRSAPSTAASVIGGDGSAQTTENPSAAKAAAAVNQATPPPEMKMSVSVTMLMVGKLEPCAKPVEAAFGLGRAP